MGDMAKTASGATAATPREDGGGTDSVRVIVRQPAHRVRGWLARSR